MLTKAISPIFLLAPVLGFVACGGENESSDLGQPIEVRLVEQRIDLMRFAGEARKAFPDVRKTKHEELVTGRFLLLELGSQVEFGGLNLPTNAQLQFELVRSDTMSRRRIACRIELRTRDDAGTEAVSVLNLDRELDPGQSGARIQFDLHGPEPVRSIVLAFEKSPGDTIEKPSMLAVVRPRVIAEVPAPPLDPVPGARNQPKQVILITLDTFRADYMHCYGNEQVESPNLDAFAANSIRFESCYSAANVTKPSHTSIFTSLYLKDHRVVNNSLTLGSDTPTLIEALGAEGMRTAAFVSTGLFDEAHSELSKRFDDYYRCRSFSRRAEDVHADLFPWLREHASEDFFIWVHYFDTHTPYQAPAPHGHHFLSVKPDSIPAPTDPKYGWGKVLKNGVQVAKELYMGEIRYLDEQFGELVEHLKNLGVYDRTHMILTADHGESLGEFNLLADHAGLSDATTHVPLIIKLPDSRLRNVIGGLVSTVDIYPTLFDFLDLQLSHPLRGESLRPLMEAGEDSARNFVISEHSNQHQVSLRTSDELFILALKNFSFGRSYVRHRGDLDLYDYGSADPLARNLARRRSARAAELRAELELFMRDRMNLSSRMIEDAEFEETLEALGYGGGDD